MRNVSTFLTCRQIPRAWPTDLLLKRGKGSIGSYGIHRIRPLNPNLQSQYRGAKSKTTIQLDELSKVSPDAELPALASDDEGPTYPRVVLQARENMQKYENCVLLTKVGGFYELYFAHADKYGPLLNLKVGQKRTAAGPVSMAGFPAFQLDRFLKVLVQDLNEFVAISEEFPNDPSGAVKSGGLLFDRRVTRTISPGTLIDEKFMDPYENNFLLAIAPEDAVCSGEGKAELTLPAELTQGSLSATLSSKTIGLAWLDLSTGDFFTQATTMGGLTSATARIRATEIVLDSGLGNGLRDGILNSLEQQRHLVTYHFKPLGDPSVSSWTSTLEVDLPAKVQDDFTTGEIIAGSLLLAYVKDRLQGLGVKLQLPIRRQDKESMSIDKNSMRALEVLGTSKEGLGGGKGSLFHTVRRTVTKSGTRLLRDRIASPSMSLPIINERLDIVSMFLQDKALREHIRTLLRGAFDSQRLVQKFSMGRGDADDLISLLKTVEVTNAIAETLEENSQSSDKSLNSCNSLQKLGRRLSLDGPHALAARIRASIDEDGLMGSHQIDDTENTEVVAIAQEVLQSQGSAEDQAALSQVSRSKIKHTSSLDQDALEDDRWTLRKTASAVLEQLHEELDGLRQDKESLASRLREELNLPSLTLRWTPSLGYHCHVKGTKDVSATVRKLFTIRDIKTTKSTRSFHQSEWSSLGNRIDQAKIRIRSEEQRVLQELRTHVVLNLVKLRRNAVVLDELDIGCSFATLAEEQRLTRPMLNYGLDHKIIGGRHPTVKMGLEEQGRAFVSNDCLIGEKERIWLITGPNMAGKSTFLRQNALISILAQVGSFVPAEHAEIGLVDQIFTRVGSADNLFRDQSTFMVEMMETATILTQATSQSFVIMDEIGRGTTPEDGIAVGYACLHHLYHKNRCRTLFATHFHALADMTKTFEHLACYCTDVAEGPGDSFSFVHRLQKGVNRSSHALKVARLAGVPEAALQIAGQVLEDFTNGSISNANIALDSKVTA